MINKRAILIFSFLAISFLSPASVQSQDLESWKKWLKDVEPIITKAEEEVFKSLKIEEDRMKFISSFWRVRDPNPRTPQNEYKLDYCFIQECILLKISFLQVTELTGISDLR